MILNSNRLNVIFTIDEKYVQHFSVALISLLTHNNNLNIFVVNDIKNKSIIEQLDSFFSENYQINIKFLSIESSVFDLYKINHHVSKATYFRLLLADIMPVDIDYALFLDSDIVVNGSLTELTKLDIKDNYVLAVSEGDDDNIHRITNLGIKIKDYFNAGVMMLNLKAFREHNVTEKLIYTAEKYMTDLLWWDQDVLNMCLYSKRGYLDSRFNAKSLTKKQKLLPVIVHYTGASKPWQYLNNHPYKNLYWKYLKLSPFKNYKYPDFTIKNLVKRIVFFNKIL